MFDGCEHSINVSSGNDVFLKDILFELLSVFFEHLELREKSFAFPIQKLSQLACSCNSNYLIVFVEINKIKKGISRNKALIS